MNSYEEKQEARKQRYLELADKARQEAANRHEQAHAMASIIPFGQPILVDHHSEKRDRNYRAKIHRTFGKSFEALNKAEHYEDKAASVGTGGISADDPEALAENRKEQDALYSQTFKYSWQDFLRERAEDGDETALAVLRSRKKAVAPEAAPPTEEQSQAKARPDYAALAALKAEAAEQQARIVESDGLTRKGKRQLQAFLCMDELTQEEKLRGSTAPYLDGITRRIDNKGAVIFTLPTGGKVLDTGSEVYFSGNDEAARKIAHLYAQKKWANA